MSVEGKNRHAYVIDYRIVYFLDRRNVLDRYNYKLWHMNKSAITKKEEYKAKFTDKELEYIYDHVDVDANPKLMTRIEKKIRKQIKKYRQFDAKLI